MPTDGEAGAELAMQEPSQRATLGHEVGCSLALLPNPHLSLEKKFPGICPSFHLLPCCLKG